MDITTLHGDIREVTADAVVVNLFEGVERPGGATGALDGALDGAIADLIEAGDLTGKLGEVAVLYPRGAVPARRVIVTGLGPRERFGLEPARRAAAAATTRAWSLGARRVATIAHGAGIGGLDAAAAAQATAEGGALVRTRYRAPDDDPPEDAGELILVAADAEAFAAVAAGAAAARATVAGATLARRLVDTPPNLLPPAAIADVAREIADRHDLDATIGDRAWIEAQGMGALLAVAAGSRNDPRFVALRTNAGASELPHVVLVGKGVTFDSGGLSLKTRTGMITMKSDMGGAAAVLGALEAVARLELPLRVTGVIACVENMPDGAAYRPSDVITAGDGSTVEIISTDAEGRLALADALHWTKELAPDAVIDLATLTGSAVTALGRGVAAALFSNDDALAERLERAAEASFERVWRLPLFEDYRKAIDSDVADLKNSGGAGGGVGTSAVFLQHFTDYPWAHLDIAGMAFSSKKGEYGPKGATGFGVRLLVEALRRWEA